MRTCFVCDDTLASTAGHHVVPQAYGGREGPVVTLCASCHQTVHSAASAVRRGDDAEAERLICHLDDLGRERARGLAALVVASAAVSERNPNPTLSVTLDDPNYLDALKRFQTESGFTSQRAAVNGMLHALAVRYGLVDEEAARTVKKRGKLSDFR